jgi:predicted permease
MTPDHWIYTIPLRLRSLFRRNTVEKELDEELRSHVECETEACVHRGMSADEARAAALRKIHGAELYKDEVRDAWGVGFIDSIRQDVRYTLRTLLKSPVFTLVAIVSLSLGIGANTSIFSLMDVLLIRPLPVAEPDQLSLVRLDERQYSFSYPLFQQVHDHNGAFSSSFAYSVETVQVPEGQDILLMPAVYGSGDYFAALRVAPTIGRIFGPDDDRKGGGPSGLVALIRDGLWSRKFGRDPSVIGRAMTINGQPVTIIGVTPAGFFGVEVGTAPDLFMPLNQKRELDGAGPCMESTSCWFLRVMGRRKPDISPDQAEAALRVISGPSMEATTQANMRADRKAAYQKRVIHAEAGKSGFSRLRLNVRDPLKVLMGLVVIVLLIACANMANLLTARATARAREVGVRLAIGATRARLVRQFLTESVILSASGAVGGFVFSIWSTRVLLSILSTTDNPVRLDLRADWRVLLFSSTAALAAGLLFGTAPALRATAQGVAAAIKERGRHGRGGEPAGFGKALLGVQVGLSVVLLAAAGLFAGSLVRLLNLNPGFDADRLTVISVVNSRPPRTGTAAITLFNRLAERARMLPGVEAATVVWPKPLTNSGWNDFATVPGRSDLAEDQRLVDINVVGTQYTRTWGVRLAAGRDFDAGDTATSEKVIMISENAARRFFPDGGALGRQISIEKNVLRRIVGIVGDTKYRTLKDEIGLVAYVPYTQSNNNGYVALRTSIPPGGVLPMFRQILRDEAPGMPVGTVVSMRQQIDESLSTERLTAYLSVFIGLLALLLTSIGLYGILAYSVMRRTSEIGVRVALGARRTSVVWLVVREAMVHTLTGIAVGVAVVLGASKVVRSLLYDLKPNDPATIAAAVGVLVFVCALAAALPARRAARLDPMQALREE